MELVAARASQVRQAFDAQGLMRTIGAEIVQLAYGRCSIKLPHSKAVTQQQGFVHGGSIGAIADSAGGFAAMTTLPLDRDVVTLEYKINFLRPAIGSEALAVGEIVRAGRQVIVTRVDVSMLEGGETKLCAVLQQSVMAARN